MKRLLAIMMFTFLLAACGSANEQDVSNQEVEQQEQLIIEESTAVVDDKKIDTSVYQYATNVEVTNAIDITQHVTLMIDMPTDKEGLAFQHVVNQTYDFLQQPDIEGAKTVSVNVRKDGIKIGMFTVNTDKFKPNDQEPMADAVLNASEIEMLSPEVKEFGKVMELW